MKWLHIIAAIGVATPGMAAEEVWLPQYGTERRERGHAIKSIWHDLRTPTLLTLPGAAPRHWGWVKIGYLGWGLNYEELDDDAWFGWRNEVGVHVHQRLLGDLFIEGRAQVATGTTDELAISDPWIGVAYYLNQRRYGGLAFTASYGFPSNTKDLEASHEADAEDGTYQIGLRLSEGWDFWIFQGNLSASYFQDGETRIEDSIRTDDGEVIPAGDWAHDQLRMEAAFAATYRLTRWLRIGGEAKGGFVQWAGSESGDDRDIQDWRLPSAFLVEARFTEHLALQLAGGADLVALFDDEADDPWVAGASLVVGY